MLSVSYPHLLFSSVDERGKFKVIEKLLLTEVIFQGMCVLRKLVDRPHPKRLTLGHQLTHLI